MQPTRELVKIVPWLCTFYLTNCVSTLVQYCVTTSAVYHQLSSREDHTCLDDSIVCSLFVSHTPSLKPDGPDTDSSNREVSAKVSAKKVSGLVNLYCAQQQQI